MEGTALILSGIKADIERLRKQTRRLLTANVVDLERDIVEICNDMKHQEAHLQDLIDIHEGKA